jgi:hypothetical protein
MSIALIFIIAVIVTAIGVKVHRGTLFRWGNGRGAPNGSADERDADGFR